MKHAWLIIAHNQFGILQRLLSSLDDERSDFYVHIDRKVLKLPDLHVQKGHLCILDHRIDVRWGTVSLIETEMTLFSVATQTSVYDYYHVISGTTLPLKSMDELDSYFSGLGKKSVLTGVCKDEPYQETLKIHRCNFFMKNYASQNPFLRKNSQFLWKSAIAVQRLLGIRINRNGDYFKASQWLSLPHEAVQYLLSRKEDILKTYRYSFCGDEYFIPSELMSSPVWRERIVSDNAYLKHHIGRSNAETLSLEDLPTLRQSGYLFARKFAQ